MEAFQTYKRGFRPACLVSVCNYANMAMKPKAVLRQLSTPAIRTLVGASSRKSRSRWAMIGSMLVSRTPTVGVILVSTGPYGPAAGVIKEQSIQLLAASIARRRSLSTRTTRTRGVILRGRPYTRLAETRTWPNTRLERRMRHRS